MKDVEYSTNIVANKHANNITKEKASILYLNEACTRYIL